MKAILLSVAFALFTVVGFSQTNSLTIWNSSATTIYVKAGASTTACTGFNISTPGLVAIPVGGFFAFPAPGALTDVWYGVKATNSLTAPTAYGAFYSPCNPCGIDNSSGLNIQWDVANGCFRAKIY